MSGDSHPADPDPGTQRLDVALAARGLARSRNHAASLIAEGLVSVDGRPAVKASVAVTESQLLDVAGADHYVSRAAHKLLAALDVFEVAVSGRLALDLGASTGGFTQVLLERGAREVIALDVGHAQLAPSLRADDRVVVLEGVNARSLTADSLAALVAAARPAADPGVDAAASTPDLVVGDLSFISLTQVLPAIVATAPAADLILLVKPQFEVGRSGVKEGIVRSAGLREDALNGVLWAAWDLGLGTAGVTSSPIAGGAGNREYLVHLGAGVGTNPTEWRERVAALTA